GDTGGLLLLLLPLRIPRLQWMTTITTALANSLIGKPSSLPSLCLPASASLPNAAPLSNHQITSSPIVWKSRMA
ncbi:hypothetical protein BDZ97DRAFT_1794584, partial [Flammula alnicola]